MTTTHAKNRGHRGQPWRVVGVVLRGDGSPIACATVRVQRQGIRKTEDIARNPTAVTGADGRFVFEYAQPARRLDLRVELLPDRGLGIDATRPKLVASAGPEESVDFVANDEPFRGPSDVERLVATLTPILHEEGIELADLATLEDVERALLAAKAGVDPSEVVLLAQSMALANETALPAQLFYGMGKQKLLLALPAVLAHGTERRRAAVEAALRANQIPRALEATVDNALKELDRRALARTLGPTGRIGALLDLAAVPSEVQQKLVADYAARDGEVSEFWTRVREQGDLGADEVDRVQLVLQLGAVTQNHPPLVRALLDRGVGTLDELAALDLDEWHELVSDGAGSGTGLPPELTAAGVSEGEYAAMVFGAIEAAFPTRMVAHWAARFDDTPLLAGFFAANPTFDLRATPLPAYLREHPDAFDFAGGDAAAVAARVHGLARTYRIAPPGARVATMQHLLAGGLDSAQKIRVLGRTEFLRRYRDLLGVGRADAVWARAAHTSAMAATLLARHGAMSDRTQLPMLPERIDDLTALRDYRALFGSVDFCACSHCQSLYSPAAYLVDLLHWLANRSAVDSSKSALEILFDGRRADIGTIELSCKNTNTELPYVDLVNEVLELAVSPPVTPPAYQTRGSAAGLRAHPEHQRDDAYAVLAGAATATGSDAVYPFHLPFNLWLDEARTYLAQLGVERHMLMATVLGRDVAAMDPAVAAEALAMSPLEWDIVAGNDLTPARPLAAMWGRPADSTLLDGLARVPAFLEAGRLPNGAAMPFEELTDLLRTNFVQAAGPLGIWFESTSCDTSRAELIGLAPEHLARIHRFVRLRRRLGWPARALDRAIQILGAGTLDEPALVRISHAARSSSVLRLSIEEQLTWWGPLETRRWSGRLRRGVPAGVAPGADGFGMVFDDVLTPRPASGDDPSPYDQLFQNDSAAVGAIFGVAADGRSLADETSALADHTASIAAALGVTAGELEVLGAHLPNDRLSLANLSALRRQVSAARALGSSIGELARSLGLIDVSPFDAAHPEHALRFAEEGRANRASGVSLAELDYLLRRGDAGVAGIAPREDAVGRLLFGIRETLRTEGDPTVRAASIIDRVSSATGLDARTTALLLRDYVRHPDATGQPLLDIFTAGEVRDFDRTEAGTAAPTLPTAVDLPLQFAAYERLHGIALVLRRLRVSAAELPWVMGTGPANGTLDLRSLPVAGTTAAAGYAGWSRLRDAIALRDRSTTGQLVDLWERAAAVAAEADPVAIATAHVELLSALEARMGWSRAELELLIGLPATATDPGVPSALGLHYPADFADERGLAHLHAVIALAGRIGLGVAAPLS